MAQVRAIRVAVGAIVLAAVTVTLWAQEPFGTGLERAARGDWSGAAESFQVAISKATAADDRARAHYNRGTVLVRAGVLQEGINELIESLRLIPENDDARVNLTIARAQLLRQPPPPAASVPNQAIGTDHHQQMQFRIETRRTRGRSRRDW